MRKVYFLFVLLMLVTVGCGESSKEKTTEDGNATTEALTVTADSPVSTEEGIVTETTEYVEPVITPIMYSFHDDTYEVTNIDSDKILYYDFDSLDSNSQLVVIGSFVDDAKMELMDSHEPVEKFVASQANFYQACNTFQIEQVLRGDVSEGDTITIAQRYAWDDENKMLYMFSDLTPMEKGDKWIYFLNYSNGVYYAAGDFTGRYPYMKLDEEKVLNGEYTMRDVGSIVENLYQNGFGYNMYKAVVEKYDIKFE